MVLSLADTDRPVNHHRFGRAHLELLIDFAKETPETIRAAIRMLQAFDQAAPVETRRGAGAVEEATAGLAEAVAHLTPPPPQSMTPAVPVAAATAIPAATDPASSTGADALVDSAGVKWDPKLHTSTKTKTIDGKWKARKPREAPVPLVPVPVPGVTTGTVPPPPPPPPPVSMTPPPPPSVLVPSAEPEVNDDEPEVNVEADSGGTGMVSTGEAQVIDFATFIVQITTALNAGEITQARIHEVQTQFGLTSLFSLNDTEAAKLQDVARAFGFAS